MHIYVPALFMCAYAYVCLHVYLGMHAHACLCACEHVLCVCVSHTHERNLRACEGAPLSPGWVLSQGGMELG